MVYAQRYLLIWRPNAAGTDAPATYKWSTRLARSDLPPGAIDGIVTAGTLKLVGGAGGGVTPRVGAPPDIARAGGAGARIVAAKADLRTREQYVITVGSGGRAGTASSFANSVWHWDRQPESGGVTRFSPSIVQTKADAAALVYALGGAPGSDKPLDVKGWQYSPPKDSDTGRTTRVFPTRVDGALPTEEFGAGRRGADGGGGVAVLEYFVPTPAISLNEERGYPSIESAVQRSPGFVAKVAIRTCPQAVQAVEIFWDGNTAVPTERVQTPDSRSLARNEIVMLQATHRFDTPGVYRPLVRVEGPYAQVLYALPQISITGGPVRADCSIITAPRTHNARV